MAMGYSPSMNLIFGFLCVVPCGRVVGGVRSSHHPYAFVEYPHSSLQSPQSPQSPQSVKQRFLTHSQEPHFSRLYQSDSSPVKGGGLITDLLSNTNGNGAEHDQQIPAPSKTSLWWSSPKDATGGDPPEYHPIESTPILDQIQSPADIKKLEMASLKDLADELRFDVINTVSQTGGHLSSSLGVIELSIALHYVYDTPTDRIVWDVSHQAYPHKILTGRRSKMRTIRQKGGLSGFCKRSESVYDCFGAGHSSTSIGAVQGMSIGRSLCGAKENRCIAVIGDGAITGGQAWEAMNSLGHLGNPALVILNDNGQVSLPTGLDSAGGKGPQSALSASFARLLTSHSYLKIRDSAKTVTSFFPNKLKVAAAKVDDIFRSVMTGGASWLFEELGFYYVGPVDGHNIKDLVAILENIRDETELSKPVFLHVKTIKGYGYIPAERASDTMHGVLPFNILTGKALGASSPLSPQSSQSVTPQKTSPPAYTSVFAKELIRLGGVDDKVVAITAAMPGGTGVGEYSKVYPERTFDVGIAEQHAVTMAAGMATEGVKPFVAIYSTFLQRAYDQIIHDVVIQKLPVRFILDRAGLVGADGATHHGSFDLAYLGTLPDIIIMAPSDELELINMVATAHSIDHLPSVVRFPRGKGYGLDTLNSKLGHQLAEMPTAGTPVTIGKGRVVRVGRGVTMPVSPVGVEAPNGVQLSDTGINEREKDGAMEARNTVAILTLGTRLHDAVMAAEQIEAHNSDVGVTVADARFMRPLDIDLIRTLAKTHSAIVTIEEGAVGGFGDHVLHFMALDGLLDTGNFKIRPLVFPDKFIEAGTAEEQMEMAGLDIPHITNTIKRILQKSFTPIIA